MSRLCNKLTIAAQQHVLSHENHHTVYIVQTEITSSKLADIKNTRYGRSTVHTNGEDWGSAQV